LIEHPISPAAAGTPPVPVDVLRARCLKIGKNFLKIRSRVQWTGKRQGLIWHFKNRY